MRNLTPEVPATAPTNEIAPSTTATLPFRFVTGPGDILDADDRVVASVSTEAFTIEESDAHGQLLARGADHARVLVEVGAGAEEIADLAAAYMSQYSSGAPLTPQSVALALGTLTGLAVVLRDRCRTALGDEPGGKPDGSEVDPAYYRSDNGEIPKAETGKPSSLGDTPAGKALLAAATRVHEEDDAQVVLSVLGKPGVDGYSWVEFEGSWIRVCEIAGQLRAALRAIAVASKVPFHAGKLAAIVGSFARPLGCPVMFAKVDEAATAATPKDSPFFGTRRMGNG